MFRSDYYERATKRRFLLSFENLISRAVQPHEEAIKYVPTQIVAEYISNVLGLDGILYASAQLGGVRDEDDEPPDRTTLNVALFNRASVVAGAQRRPTRRATELTWIDAANQLCHFPKPFPQGFLKTFPPP